VIEKLYFKKISKRTTVGTGTLLKEKEIQKLFLCRAPKGRAKVHGPLYKKQCVKDHLLYHEIGATK
jgi:hypothetical protein